MTLRAGLYAIAALALLAPRTSFAQDRGATALGDALAGLPVSVRVLVIGAHPDDEDNRLITYLAKGRHADVAYLSLTRGDGGQNLIGNELGEALGVIRTEELLAARRVDGAQQYFTRAYDFGFSKSAAETFKHWPHDTLLTDVVTVVRAFRPHVIIAVFSGTPRDGHGHHQVSGILAREAYDASGDSAKFPASATKGLAPWTPLKFYRTTSYWSGAGATFRYNAGEYSPLLGRSYAEIAGESRSQHQSQGQGGLQRKGFIAGSVKREASRVPGAPGDAGKERSIFDGIDTTYRRLRSEVSSAQRPRADSLVALLSSIGARYEPARPEALVPALERAERLARTLSSSTSNDASTSLVALRDAAAHATALARGIAIEATVPREALALGDSMTATVAVYDRDAARLAIDSVTLSGSAISGSVGSPAPARAIARDSVASWTFTVRATALTAPWWLTPARTGDLFASPVSTESAERAVEGSAFASVYLADGTVLRAPLVQRIANPVRGEEQRPLAVVPAISVTLERAVGYARASAPLDRELRVTLRSAYEAARDVSVRLELPQGLSADTLVRTVSLAGMGAARTIVFRVRGSLTAGRHVITAVAESGGQRFETGYVAIRYDHIRPQTIVRSATTTIEAVDVELPHGVSVAYVQGVGDNSAPMLAELGVPVTMLDAHGLAAADLSRFTTVVIGTRAYESDPSLAAQNARLFEWVSNGGTMVVQYGQGEMTQPGMMPFPISLSSPAARVTDEASPITVLAPNDPLLNAPNRITDADWRGWVQDRALYMPSTIDSHYQTVIATNDPGEPANPGGILRASVGRGSYIYTTLAFFRQLPAGVPGAARLFVNLLCPSGRELDARGTRGVAVRARGGSIVAAMLALAACSGDGRTVLTIYSPHGKDLLEHYEAGFEKAHPNVDVQWVDMGSQDVLDRLRSEAANPQADVWFGAPTEVFDRAAAAGLLMPYKPTWAGVVPPEAKGESDLWYGTYLTPEVIAYNSAAVSEADAPKDWDDVLDPKWKGKVIIRDPLPSGSMRAIFGAMIVRGMGASGSPDSGYAWLRRLDASTKEYALDPGVLYQKLGRQEGLISLYDMPDIAQLRGRLKIPVQYVIPSSGTPVLVDAIAIVKGTKHADLAKQFYEFVTTPAALEEASNSFYRIPARTDIPLDSLPQWVRDAKTKIKPMPLDRALLSKHLDEWMRYWDSNIRNRSKKS